MKEYQSKTGGRHLFNEDLHNLQELALSATKLFEDCGLDFVITGCKINAVSTNSGMSYSITEGYCFLNGKVRYVPSRDLGIVVPPFYICENNITQGNQISYADGSSDEEFIEYGSVIKHAKETVYGNYIVSDTFENNEVIFPNLRSAFFKSYALIKNSNVRQYIYSLVTFNQGVTLPLLNLINGSNTSNIKLDSSGNLVVELSKQDNHTFILKFIRANGSIELYDGSSKIWGLDTDSDGAYMKKMKIGQLNVTESAKFKELSGDSFNASKKVASNLYEVLNGGKSILQIKPMTIKNVNGVAIVTNISGSRETTYFFGNDSIGFYSIDGGAELNIIKNGLYYNNDFTAENIKANKDVYENGKKLSEVYMKKVTDSDWFALENISGGTTIPGLSIRNKWDIQIAINGNIPKSFINIPYDYNRSYQSNANYYKYPLGIRVPSKVSLPTQEKEIGSQFYVEQVGYQTLNIPVYANTKMLVAFVAKLTNCCMTGHGGASDAWCVIGIGADRQLYLCGARFLDYCSWNSYYQFYASSDTKIEARAWLD